MSGEAETSTPLESHFPIYSKRQSSMLKKSPRIREIPNFSRVTFELGDEDMPVAKRFFIGEGLYSNSQSEKERTGFDFGFSKTERFERVVAAK